MSGTTQNGRLLGYVLAGVRPEDGQHEDLERLDDGDVYQQHEERGDGPEGGAGGVEGQAEDDCTGPAQETDDRRQADRRHEEPVIRTYTSIHWDGGKGAAIEGGSKGSTDRL